MNALSPAWRVSAQPAFELPVSQPLPSRRREPAPPRPILAFVDRSPEAANAAWRGALVARDRGLPLHLVAVEPLEARLGEAADLAGALADQVRGKLGLPVSSQGLAGTLDHEGVDAAQGASLLVLPSAAARRGWLRGSPALRLLRRSKQPVLVVRLPAYASYRRVLAAVKLDTDACSLVAAAQALSRDPRFTVLHVLQNLHEETMRLADVPYRVIRAQRDRDAQAARQSLVDLIAGAGAGHDGAQPLVTFGAPAHQVLAHELARRVDLLVVGKAPRPGLVDLLVDGVAQAALRDAAADVLVLPMLPRARTAAWPRPGFA